jgi:hypothetical protein
MFLFSQLILVKQNAAQDSQWSREATSLPFVEARREIHVLSPDKQKEVVVEGTKLKVVIKGKASPELEDYGVQPLAELLWSPNSNAFFLTESDGGEVGTWNVTIYEIKGTQVRKLFVSKHVLDSFRKRYTCTESEEPNITAVKWINGGSKVLLVAQVPPHSSCRNGNYAVIS